MRCFTCGVFIVIVIVLLDYYLNCEILFMSLANIHTIRKSFLALRTICATSPDQPGFVLSVYDFNTVYEARGVYTNIPCSCPSRCPGSRAPTVK